VLVASYLTPSPQRAQQQERGHPALYPRLSTPQKVSERLVM